MRTNMTLGDPTPIPQYLRGHRCRRCHKDPEVVIVSSADTIDREGHIGIRCDCIRIVAKVDHRDFLLGGQDKILHRVKKLSQEFEDLKKTIGEPPAGRDYQTHAKIIMKFLKEEEEL